MGKGYLQIDIDREKAARYGITVEDIQNEIEVALGGRAVTFTVEKRDRFPVRIRYARASREDEEADPPAAGQSPATWRRRRRRRLSDVDDAGVIGQRTAEPRPSRRRRRTAPGRLRTRRAGQAADSAERGRRRQASSKGRR